MKRLIQILWAVVLTGCAIQVKTHQNPTAGFSKYTTWCWMQGCDIVYQGPEYYHNQQAIDEMANAIAANMQSKGYIQGDDDSQLVVNFYVIVEQDSADINTSLDDMYQPERQWLMNLYPEYQHFLKGTLVIDVMDRRESKLVWTTKAIKYMDINPEFDKKMIWNGIGKAMKKFPEKEN